METDQQMLDFTMSKIGRSTYRQIRQALKQYSSRFNHLHEDNDLKQMSSVQAQEFVHWFNEEGLGVPRSKLLDNFQPHQYHEEGLPVPDNAETTIALINSNLLAYKGIAKVNQHVPFHFNMILSPEQYTAEWKLLLQQMLDFMNFKEVMVPRHLDEIHKLAQKRRDLEDRQARLSSETQKLTQLEEIQETNREIVGEQEEQTRIKLELAGEIEPELVGLRRQLEEDKEGLEKQRSIQAKLSEQRDALDYKIRETNEQRVTEDPMQIADDRDEAEKQVRVQEEQLQEKKSQQGDLQARVQSLSKIIQERKAHLEFIKSAQQLKEKKKKEKEQVIEARRQLEQIRCALQLSHQDVASLQTIAKSQEQQDRQFQEYHRQKIDNLQEKHKLSQQSLQEKLVEKDRLEREFQQVRSDLAREIGTVMSQQEEQSQKEAQMGQLQKRVAHGLDQFNEELKSKLFSLQELNPSN